MLQQKCRQSDLTNNKRKNRNKFCDVSIKMPRLQVSMKSEVIPGSWGWKRDWEEVCCQL